MVAMAVCKSSMLSKPSVLARSVTASRTARTAAPGRHAAPAPGVRRQVCVVAQNSDSSMWSAVVAARKAAAALGQPAADTAAARRAAYQTLLKLGAIAGCAAVGGLHATVGGLHMARACAAALLLVPVWKGAANFAATTTALQLKLNCRHKRRAAATRELTPPQQETMELRNEHQQVLISLRDSFAIFWMAVTAVLALCACVHAIAPASPIQLVSVVMSYAGWLVAPSWLSLFVAFVADLIKALKVRSMFFAAAAEHRKANTARRSAARSAGQP